MVNLQRFWCFRGICQQICHFYPLQPGINLHFFLPSRVPSRQILMTSSIPDSGSVNLTVSRLVFLANTPPDREIYLFNIRVWLRTVGWLLYSWYPMIRMFETWGSKHCIVTKGNQNWKLLTRVLFKSVHEFIRKTCHLIYVINFFLEKEWQVVKTWSQSICMNIDNKKLKSF